MFKSLQIRYKFLISYSIVFILSTLLVSIFIYVSVRNTIEENIESELNTTTQMILEMVKTSATVSIKNRLRAVAEKNEEVVRYFYSQYMSGKLPEASAKKQAAGILLSQTIGTSGYIYCLDSNGIVVVHPEKALLQTNVASFGFVTKMIEQKEGYIEYEWKNPGEANLRPKALYMVYFEPWDWIISVSTYRTEFNELVNVDDFEKSILSIRFGKTGYAFVIDASGKALIHPKLQGINILKTKDLPHEYLEDMYARKKGKTIYAWKNPGETKARMKLVIFNHIPEYEWIVGSSSYLEEFYRPLNTIRAVIIFAGLSALLLVLPITFKISASITNPLQKLMRHFDQVTAGDFSTRMEVNSQDEVGQLTIYFNHFMEQLEKYNKDLKEQIEVRRKAEGAQVESQGKYLSVMEAAPDPIVTYDMAGNVTYLNPAFTMVFGWDLHECFGRKLDHFVPEENWDETTRMIGEAMAGRRINNVETKRFNRNGDVISVSISGATYRDRNGNLAGSVIILRDITKAKFLEKQVMDIGDRERQKIGQDLHDDLCPHLIGVAGLATVLKTNLEELPTDQGLLAEKIVNLIEEAIQKTRTLARGLCPVHLVSHGLQTALEEIVAATNFNPNIQCFFSGDETIVIHDNIISTHLYYIAQEAVNNAVKHSGATTIDLSLMKKSSVIHLAIRDNGKGMMPGISGSGMGLQIMQYRAKMVGGLLVINTGEKEGTAVNVYLKLADRLRKGDV